MAKNQYVLFRHKLARKVFGFFILPYFRLRYHISVDKFDDSDGRPYLIVMNHQTAGDQFFINMAFSNPVYFIATEDIFSNGFSSKAIEYLTGPIPIKKNAADLKAIKTSMRVAKEGGSIALAPEGNRTFSGCTENMKPSIAKFVRALKLPLAIFRIEGGYGVHPRWSDVIRSGKMHAGVVRVVEPEEYKELSDQELFEIIQNGLYVDDMQDDCPHYHKKNAEYMERVMYVCPECGLSEFESKGDIIACKRCGRKIRYTKEKHLEGVDFEFPFKTVKEWYDYQNAFINKLDLEAMPKDEPVYEDPAAFFNVILYKEKRAVDRNAKLALYPDRITVTANGEERVLPFEDISAISVLGRNKMNIYYLDRVYQFKGDKPFNPVKYMHFYYRFSHQKGGDDNEFLGL